MATDTRTDAEITAAWKDKLAHRRVLENDAKRRHTQAQAELRAARATDAHPRQELVNARDQESETLHHRRRQVAEAKRVLARHAPTAARVSVPVDPIHGDSWGWTPDKPKSEGGGAVHDGLDVIAGWRDDVVAMVRSRVVDVRASGWWGKSAHASAGHPVSDGDGIIQLEVLETIGPFHKGDILGYGHTENAVVHVGQIVVAGQRIGHIGWAVVGHIHLMHQRGLQWTGRPQGVGTLNPRAILDYTYAHGRS